MALEQYGNTTTFNIESVLHKNIKDGEYFNKTCVKLTTFAELVDEASPLLRVPLSLPVLVGSLFKPPLSLPALAPAPSPRRPCAAPAPAVSYAPCGCPCRSTTR